MASWIMQKLFPLVRKKNKRWSGLTSSRLIARSHVQRLGVKPLHLGCMSLAKSAAAAELCRACRRLYGRMKTPFAGGCYCGAVRYECSAREDQIQMFRCHCRDCQHITGGPFVPVVIVPKE